MTEDNRMVGTRDKIEASFEAELQGVEMLKQLDFTGIKLTSGIRVSARRFSPAMKA